MSGPRLAAHITFCLLGLVACGGASGQEAAKPRKSLLVITLDTTRRDFVGWMGMTPSPTPHLDRIAAGAVVFEDALTTVPLTLPAHSSLFTGLYPVAHGVHDNGTFRLPPEATTLAEVLRERGYATRAAVAAFVLDPVFGLDQGFAGYSAPPRHVGQSSSSYAELGATAMVDRALADLAALAGTPPFFYWLHLFDPHFPYAAPQPPTLTTQESADPHRIARALYGAEIRHMDAELGRLFAWLEQRRLLDALVIVVAADHGEGLEDALERAHGHYLFDPTVRIPLFLRDPDLAPRRSPIQVSLVDVMPTLLARLGITEPSLRFDGLDLTPHLVEPAEPPPERVLALESWYVWLNYGWAPFEGCAAGPLKYVRSCREELFDRAADPREAENLFTPDDPRALGMKRRLAALKQAAIQLPAAGQVLSTAHQRLLEALGYVSGGGSGGDALPEDWSVLPDATAKAGVINATGEVAVALQRGDTAAALAQLRELVKAEPRSAALREQLGMVLLGGDGAAVAEAARELDVALRLDPRRSRCWFRRAVASSALAQQARAKAKELREAGRPADAAPFTATVAAEIERVEATLRECLRLEPDYAEALMLLTRTLLERAERRARAAEPPAARAGIVALLDEIERHATRLDAILPAGAIERTGVVQVLERVRRLRAELGAK